MRKRVRNREKKKTSIKWESTQEWEEWMMRDSMKHKTWVSSKIGKNNWMNDLFFAWMTLQWWELMSKMANLGLKRLSNQGWRDERPFFCYPFYNERLFPLANPVEPR